MKKKQVLQMNRNLRLRKKQSTLQMKAIIALHHLLHAILEDGEKHTQTLLGMDQFTVFLVKEGIYMPSIKKTFPREVSFNQEISEIRSNKSSVPRALRKWRENHPNGFYSNKKSTSY